MKFKKEITKRGFAVLTFNDDYGTECSLQKSSSIKDHVWLGVSKATPRIMCSDARKLGLPYAKNENGWQDFEIPEEAHIFTRMHLTRKQSMKLAIKLFKFWLNGKV